MTVRRRSLLGSILLVVGLVGLAAAVLVMVVLGGPPPPEPEPTPPPAEPEPEPEPEPPPAVTGEAEVVEVVDLSATDTGLVVPGSAEDAPVALDEGALDALVESISSWLDEHLTDLQDGGDGRVAEVGLVGPASAGDLAGADEIVDTAEYAFRVGVRGPPEWVRVEVRVETADGGEHAAAFAFTGRAEPELQAVEAHP